MLFLKVEITLNSFGGKTIRMEGKGMEQPTMMLSSVPPCRHAAISNVQKDIHLHSSHRTEGGW